MLTNLKKHIPSLSFPCQIFKVESAPEDAISVLSVLSELLSQGKEIAATEHTALECPFNCCRRIS